MGKAHHHEFPENRAGLRDHALPIVKKYISRFIKNEDGMETLEFLVLLSVVAGLIGIVIAVKTSIEDAGEKVASSMENMLVS